MLVLLKLSNIPMHRRWYTDSDLYNYCLYETVHIVNDLGDIAAQIEISKCSLSWSLLIPKTIKVLIKYYLYWVNALMDIN